MMALEVLAPNTEKHYVARELLADFQRTLKERVAGLTDPEALDALEALQREFEFRKETSIRRRVRQLVLDEVPLDEANRQAMAAKVVNAYDLRSTLVHRGAVDPQALSEAADSTLQAVKLILRARLGLAATPPTTNTLDRAPAS